jgi:hypothetical protein
MLTKENQGKGNKDRAGNPMKTKDVYSTGTKDSNTWEFKKGKRTSKKG